MDDIYGNLDNYNDVTALSQLRTENQDLKQRLEECTSNIGKLQKDYDNLALEFKILEMNYSSLLKTARAEIERKTRMITDLNLEKDMIVIKSLQNGGRFRRIDLRTKQSPQNSDNNATNKNVTENNYKNDIHAAHKDRKEKKSYTDNSNRLTSNSDTTDNCKDKKSDYKENLKHEQNVAPKKNARSISSRRKSMSSACIENKFSSDDENDSKRKSAIKEIPKNQALPNYKLDRKILDRVHSDRYSNRTSETSSLDERNSNYLETPLSREPSRENYKNMQNRYYSDDKYKNRDRDKYESSHRYRRHSPEYGFRKVSKEYQDDYYNRTEYGRHRASPPPADSYHNHHRKSREFRSTHDRYYNEYERPRNHQEKQSFKHKIPNDYEEPSSKRPRVESSSTNDNLHPNEEIKYSNKDINEIVLLGPHELDMHLTSCQSPDYIHTDAVTTHPVKEIIHTAAMPLEDPRTFSKKYVLKMNAEGKDTISTVSGRNVNLRSINKSTWNIERINNMPDALVCRPDQFSEELVKEIYMDIDKPTTLPTDTSIKLAEICLESKDLFSDLNKNISHETPVVDLNVPATEVYSKSSQSVNIVGNLPTFTATNYRIPKNKPNKNAPNKEKDITVKLDSEKNAINSSECPKNKSDTRTQSSILGRLIDTHDKILSKSLNETSDKTYDSKNSSQNQMSLSARAIVEGDLELSDETSDIVESNRDISIAQSNVLDSEKEIVTISDKLSSNTTKKKIEKLTEDNDTNFNKQENSSTSCETSKRSDGKKQKSKRKKSKTRDSTEVVNTENVEQIPDKKSRSKKEKEKPKEIKNFNEKKFNDLFGDSSSLIMPEDLGIGTYVPVFDDAQDAMDLNIKQINQTSVQDAEISNNNPPKSDLHKINNPDVSSNHQRPGVSIESECDKTQNALTHIKEKSQLNSNNEETIFCEPKVAVVYENLNPEIVDNNDVVKTIIISMGVQQQFKFDSNIEPVLKRPIVNVETDKSDDTAGQNALIESKRQDHIAALATSTPQKETLNDMENNISETTRNSNICGMDSVDNIPLEINQCDTQSMNTMDSVNSIDVPDVRIFVRRRRKVLKKPTAV